MLIFDNPVRLVSIMLLLALSASASSSPPKNVNRDVNGQKLAQREICEPCGMYCCGKLEFCHRDILWDELSDPYCRPFKRGGTKTDRTRSSQSQTAIPHTNTPTMRIITSTFSTRDNDFDDFPKTTATETVVISVTSKIEGLPTETKPGNIAPSSTDEPSPTTTGTSSGTGTSVGSGFTAGAATATPNDGRKIWALGIEGAWLVVMGLGLFGFFWI